jgi:hypothetical protein
MTLIDVDGKPFLGRVEEQKQFRAALQETLRPPRGETLPYVILLYGDGGIGRFHREDKGARPAPSGRRWTLPTTGRPRYAPFAGQFRAMAMRSPNGGWS